MTFQAHWDNTICDPCLIQPHGRTQQLPERPNTFRLAAAIDGAAAAYKQQYEPQECPLECPEGGAAGWVFLRQVQLWQAKSACQ